MFVKCFITCICYRPWPTFVVYNHTVFSSSDDSSIFSLISYVSVTLLEHLGMVCPSQASEHVLAIFGNSKLNRIEVFCTLVTNTLSSTEAHFLKDDPSSYTQPAILL